MNYPFQEDNLKIVVQEGNKLIAQKAFCSSYGKADVALEKDAKGNYYLLLQHGEGRGTNARSEFLSVYRLSRTLIEHVRIPVSAPSGSISGWTYEYRLSMPASGGLLITLILRVDSEDADLIPPEDQE